MPEVVETQVEQPVTATEPVEAPAEPVTETPAEPDQPHALEPGGTRFKEVWARAKAAEARVQEEREQRIRAEERARVLEEARATPPPKAEEPTYSWTQLEQMIADNKISRADAQDYRENIVRKQTREASTRDVETKLADSARLQKIDVEIGKFKDAIPNVNIQGTPERAEFDREFAYQVSMGMNPKDLTTQLTALRAVYGSPDKAAKLRKASTIDGNRRETYQETSGNGNVREQPKVDWRAKLSTDEKAHYDRMIKHGRYGDAATAWERIKTEIDEYNTRKGIK